MYYVCKVKKDKISILDTEDGVVDVFSESQARKVAATLDVPIIGLGKNKITAFKPQNGRFNDDVCDYVVHKLMYYITGEKLTDLDCDFNDSYDYYGIEDYLYNNFEFSIKIDPVYICNATVVLHISNLALVDKKLVGGMTVDYDNSEISGVVNINEALKNRGLIVRLRYLYNYLLSNKDIYVLEA